MANAMPWSVRGIDPDIREQAVEAAHRSGLSVGQWLNQVLAGNLDEDEDELPPRQRHKQRPRKVEDLDQRLARIGRQRGDTAADRFTRDDDDASPRMMGLLEQAIAAIERLDRSGGRSTAEPVAPRGEDLLNAFRALEQRVQALSQPAPASPALPRSGIAPPRATRGSVDDDPHFSAAIAEIEARRRELDAASGSTRATPRAFAAPARRMEEPRPVEQPRHLDEMRQQLDQLVSRIDDMRREQRPETARLQDRMESLAARIEEWRARPSEDIALIRRDLASLGAAIETLSPSRLVGMVENAVAGVVEKSARSSSRDPMSQRIAEAIGEMQDDIRAVMQEIANSRGSDRVAQEVGLVARKLEEIGRSTPDLSRLDDIMREADSIKALIGQAMRAQPLEGLTHQIDALGKELERFARQPAPVRDDRPVIDAIREVRDRVERIDPAATFAGVEQRLAAIANVEARLGALSGIEEKLETIARDVSKLAKDAKPLPQLDSIAARLERIDKVLDGNKKQPLAGLDDLAAKVEKLGLSLEKASERRDADPLVGMLEQLAGRIDAVQASRQDGPALDALQDEIARLGTRLEQLSPGTPALDGVERQVSDLLAQFDMARRDFSKDAAAAAEMAAREAVKGITRDDSGDTLAAEGLLLLKRDLGEFKNQQGESERRTRQMLEALHGTLEAVATRLGQIEQPRFEPRPQPASSASQVTAAKPAAAPPMPAAKAEAPAPRPEPAKPAAPPMTAARAPDVIDDFADLPLEPGQRPGEATPAASADPIMSADPRTNFIAAARRAAQVAAEQSKEAMAVEAEASRSAGLAAKLKGLLVRKPKDVAAPDAPGKTGLPPLPGRERSTRANLAAAAAMPAKAAGGSFISRQRRPILLGLAALIMALAALKVMRGGNETDAGIVPPVPPAQERVLPQSETSTPTPRVEQRSQAPAAKPADDVARTASIPPVIATAPDGQQVVIPTLNAPPPAGAKRAQRLGETSAVSQADPITVGSISTDGAAKPLDTGRDALSELAGLSNLKGQDRLRELATAGNAAAIFEIGARLADGRGMARDARLAARWFEQAAAQGHGPSQYRLASLYREGRGVAKDAALAFQWFDRAAAQGHVLAMHNAAVLLAEGVHGAPDYAGAALWFRRAAEHGVKDSQFNVAILFARGLGVNQDLVESYRWFSASAAQGDQDAAKKRDDLGARLTKEQLAKERDWLKNFVPTKPNPAANEAGNWETAQRPAAAAPAPRTSRAP